MHRTSIELCSPYSTAGIRDLMCPRCARTGLRYGEVLVYNRHTPGLAQHTVTSVLDGRVSSHRAAGEQYNAAPVHDGIIISFVCEHCDDNRTLELCLSQHRGMMEMFWRNCHDKP